MTLIDCDNLPVVLDRFYSGMTGPKIGVKYEGRVWMSFDHDHNDLPRLQKLLQTGL